jgi:hypothetical protein
MSVSRNFGRKDEVLQLDIVMTPRVSVVQPLGPWCKVGDVTTADRPNGERKALR